MSWEREMAKIAGITDHRLVLEAIRDRLAQFLDGDIAHRTGCECECGVPPDLRTLPSTAKELREILKDLADLPEISGESEVDQLAAARKARQEAARVARLALPADEERPRPAGNKRGRRGDPPGRSSGVGA
jgi:hypothetical protein